MFYGRFWRVFNLELQDEAFSKIIFVLYYMKKDDIVIFFKNKYQFNQSNLSEYLNKSQFKILVVVEILQNFNGKNMMKVTFLVAVHYDKHKILNFIAKKCQLS